MFVRPKHQMQAVERLAAEGLNKCEISRLTGIPRSTIKTWLLDGLPEGKYRGGGAPLPAEDLPPAEYAYLLGVYLGDGHIVRMPRTHLLRIYCDARYTEILSEIELAIRAVVPGASTSRVGRPGRCVAVSSHWKHWPDLLPQHGAGRKHERPIRLTTWQRAITTACPGALVRGLLHSDGCRFVARQRKRRRTGHYAYVRYAFSNRSDDIKDIFSAHLALLGVEWTVPNDPQIQIARRESVEILERIVGPKR